MARPYFSQRKHGVQPLTLDQMKSLFLGIVNSCERNGFLQEQFGRENDDGDYRGGKVEDVPAYLLLHLRKSNLWPVKYRMDSYTEDDVFDMIELLYRHVSKGILNEGAVFFDDYGHFDKQAGQAEFRARVNEVLSAYGDGFELSPDAEAEVFQLSEEGLRELLAVPVPTEDERIKAKVDSAVSRYRSRHSNIAERRNAVRDLADVCELLNPMIKKSMTRKDEDGLFIIANGYGFRHHNDIQKTDYGPEWLSWFFYLYLSTIHLLLRVMNREKAAQASAPDFPE